MMRVDVLVIGAGPAGIAAALGAHAVGLSALVVDENAQPGGQIYRSLQDSPLADAARVLGADYLTGTALLEAFSTSGIAYLARTRVWQIEDDHGARVAYLAPLPGQSPPTVQIESQRSAAAATVHARFVVLATGAQERPLPLPGWTLPGVISVGAAQILLKGAGLLPPADVVLIGSGPLLDQFAWQVVQAGGRVQAIIDTRGPIARGTLLRALPAAMKSPALLWRGVRLLAALRRHGVRRIHGARALSLIGDQELRGVRFELNGKEQTLPSSAVLLHAGLIPETNFSSALGLEHDWNRAQYARQVRRNAWQESSRAGLFVVGDGGGIVGADAALASGRLAALEIARRAGKISTAERDAQARPLLRQWHAKLAPRPFLDALYPPSAACFAPADEAIVCRCENVSAGQIRRAARLGANGPNQIKAFTRAGMGACQGRMCACVTATLAAEASGLDIAQVAMLRARYPVKPVTLDDIARSCADESEPLS